MSATQNLVVEDDPHVRGLLHTRLSAGGSEVAKASAGRGRPGKAPPARQPAGPGDHSGHGTYLGVPGQGLADRRGLPPGRRAQQTSDHCARPDDRSALQDYLDRATASSPGKHTPHLIEESLSWHARYLQEGTMQPA